MLASRRQVAAVTLEGPTRQLVKVMEDASRANPSHRNTRKNRCISHYLYGLGEPRNAMRVGLFEPGHVETDSGETSAAIE